MSLQAAKNDDDEAMGPDCDDDYEDGDYEEDIDDGYYNEDDVDAMASDETCKELNKWVTNILVDYFEIDLDYIRPGNHICDSSVLTRVMYVHWSWIR